jgi:hypothetical protein
MNVRRFVAGVLLAGLAVPLVGAAPRDGQRAKTGPQSAPRGMGTRVFARVDGPEIGQAVSPLPSASASVPASASPAPAISPASSPSPELAAKARAEFVAWQSAKIDSTRYIPEAKTQFTPTFVNDISSKYLKPLGTLQSITQIQKTTAQAAQIYVYRVVCDKGTMNMAISWNDAGLVQFIRFVPPQS